jgi:hypothetical protein
MWAMNAKAVKDPRKLRIGCINTSGVREQMSARCEKFRQKTIRVVPKYEKQEHYGYNKMTHFLNTA